MQSLCIMNTNLNRDNCVIAKFIANQGKFSDVSTEQLLHWRDTYRGGYHDGPPPSLPSPIPVLSDYLLFCYLFHGKVFLCMILLSEFEGEFTQIVYCELDSV